MQASSIIILVIIRFVVTKVLLTACEFVKDAKDVICLTSQRFCPLVVTAALGCGVNGDEVVDMLEKACFSMTLAEELVSVDFFETLGRGLRLVSQLRCLLIKFQKRWLKTLYSDWYK